MNTWKAEFTIDGVFFYIEMFGTADECWKLANILAGRFNAAFTGCLEEVK